MARQAGVIDPRDHRMLHQPCRQRQCVRALGMYPQVQRFRALKEQECVERGRAHTDVAHALKSGFHDEGGAASFVCGVRVVFGPRKIPRINDAVIAFIRGGEFRETTL